MAQTRGTTNMAEKPNKQDNEQREAMGKALGFADLGDSASVRDTLGKLGTWAVAMGAKGRQGVTMQGVYYSALALAQAANQGKAVTPAQVAATYLAAGATAPGRRNADGYAAKKRFTHMHSAVWGTKHLAGNGVVYGKANEQGANTYSAQRDGAAIAASLPATVLAALAKRANAKLAQYTEQVCGCTGGKKPCGSKRRGTDPLTGPARSTVRKVADKVAASVAAPTAPVPSAPSTDQPS